MADNIQTATIAAQLARLHKDYHTRLPADLTALVALANGLCGNADDRARLDELHFRLHKLAGSGGTFGLDKLGAQAHKLEHLIQQWLAGSLDTLDTQTCRDFSEQVARLGETVSSPAQTPQLHTAPLPAVTSVSGKPIQIWLIEDDPSLARQLALQLESFHYSVRHFIQISEAEAAAQTQRPDLLIMDILFPQQEEDATQALAQCPALHALDCPLLFVTARNDFQSRARAARFGAVGYFLKPLDVPSLINRITQIVDKQHAQQQRVLIVDDDVDLAAHYRLALLAAGMEAEVLHDPTAIIDTIASFRPELVLMNLIMPDYSGPELASVIRQHDRWSSLPIVYLSAVTNLDQQIEAMGRGADDFLTKPISDAQLVAAVRTRIDRARQLDTQITRDSLTGLLKHASIKEALDITVVRARRIGTPATVAMLDIDHFKRVNDTYGHAAGDVVIASLAMLMRQRLRQSDIIGRYGGEEFVAVLPECDATNASLLLEDIRQRFSTVGFSHHGQPFSCTLSAGLASSAHHPGARSAELLISADEALYAAKRGGRNQIRAAETN